MPGRFCQRMPEEMWGSMTGKKQAFVSPVMPSGDSSKDEKMW